MKIIKHPTSFQYVHAQKFNLNNVLIVCLTLSVSYFCEDVRCIILCSVNLIHLYIALTFKSTPEEEDGLIHCLNSTLSLDDKNLE